MSVADHSPQQRFLHRAVLYDSTDELLEILAPLLSDAVRGRRAVLATIDSEVERGLQERLGGRGDGLRFLATERVAGVSSQTVVMHNRWLAETLGEAGLLIGQHQAGVDAAQVSFWEAAFNAALSDLPVTMWCAYRTSEPAETLQAMRATHPELADRAGMRPNPDYRDPAAVLAEHRPTPPPALGPPVAELPFGADGLAGLRRSVAGFSRDAGLDRDRRGNLVAAVSEAATNAVEHGAGHGVLRVWHGPGELTCEVHDPGPLHTPYFGLLVPPPTSRRGRGLWLIRQLCDQSYVWSDADGTGVRMTMARGTRTPACAL